MAACLSCLLSAFLAFRPVRGAWAATGVAAAMGPTDEMVRVTGAYDCMGAKVC